MRLIYARIIGCYFIMLKMLKGLVMSSNKEVEKEQKQKEELSLRPQKGSLTAHWMNKNKK